MASCDVSELMGEAVCFQTLAGPGQWESAKLALLCNILQTLDPMATCDVQTLMSDGKCFFAGLSGGQSRAVELQLLCNIAAAVGGGGDSSLIIGSGSPEGVQTAIVGRRYWDNTGGGFYTKVSGIGNTGWQAE